MALLILGGLDIPGLPSSPRSCLIVYNCGLQHLVCGKPLAAARCFHQAIPVFSNRPLFWLRFAECSLLALEKGLLSASSSDGGIKVHIAGSGKWRQVVVDYVNSRHNYSDSTAIDDVAIGDDQILISFPFARRCLLNALLLLDTLDRKMTKLDAPAFASEVADPNQGASINLKNSNQKNMSNSDSKASNSTPASSATFSLSLSLEFFFQERQGIGRRWTAVLGAMQAAPASS